MHVLNPRQWLKGGKAYRNEDWLEALHHLQAISTRQRRSEDMTCIAGDCLILESVPLRAAVDPKRWDTLLS